MDNKNTMIVVAVRSRFSLVAFLSEYKLRKKVSTRDRRDDKAVCGLRIETGCVLAVEKETLSLLLTTAGGEI